MPLDYEIDNRLKTLVPVLDEHMAWFSRAIRLLFYPEKYDDTKSLEMPASFMEWLRGELELGHIEKYALDNLANMHNDIQQAIQKMGELVMLGEDKPDSETLDSIVALNDMFVGKLRHVELDCVRADSGIDPITGLRHRRAMDKDIEVEMERFARKGQPFSIVLARIDGFDDIRSKIEEIQYSTIMVAISAQIKKSLRSFDEAYSLSNGEFIMLMKHSDIRGGAAGIARLKNYLQEASIIAKLNDGNVQQVTMSYCMSEPTPGEKIEELLTNMRDDLQKHDDDNGEKSLEYVEQSPVKRFLGNIDET